MSAVSLSYFKKSGVIDVLVLDRENNFRGEVLPRKVKKATKLWYKNVLVKFILRF